MEYSFTQEIVKMVTNSSVIVCPKDFKYFPQNASKSSLVFPKLNISLDVEVYSTITHSYFLYFIVLELKKNLKNV